MNFLRFIWTMILGWFSKPIYGPIDDVSFIPKPEPMPQPKYLWDTKENVRHSVRVICDEEGLTVPEKNVICAVIQAESGFNIGVININEDNSEDYGLCQYNSKWYIGRMKLITKEQALTDPEFCVRLMIKRYKMGFLRDWNAYQTGAYKQYLP